MRAAVYCRRWNFDHSGRKPESIMMNYSTYLKITATTVSFTLSFLFGIRLTSVFACSGEFEYKCSNKFWYCNFLFLIYFLCLIIQTECDNALFNSKLEKYHFQVFQQHNPWWMVTVFNFVNLSVLFNWRHCRPNFASRCL